VGLTEEQKLNVMKGLAECFEMRHNRAMEDTAQLGAGGTSFIFQLQRQAEHVSSYKKCIHNFDRKT
jgi:hypothetical protein